MADWMDDIDFHGELTVSNVRIADENIQKHLLFKAIRACDLHAIRTILQANRGLLNSKMYCYEGTDIFEIIKNSKTKRCYTYTGLEKDGYCYPLHVAAEAGQKNLIILLVKAGADINLTDYRACTPEEKCNGSALHAFYELRGFKFEAKERYVGKTDRQGQRHGQGVIYYKPEGYLQEEKQLYRGSFKNNVYHGHGTLYFAGSDTIAYMGRFKDGLRHGRGIEFDEHGRKAYQGTFRDDKREGRGEEFDEAGNKIYKGEWSNNMRHGFGVAYFSEGSKYVGRYENNMMSGIGIYCHPTNDRFEGMFFNNKPDGTGSYYEKDAKTGQWIGHHAIWQVGRKVKETSTPFVPTVADLPDDSTKDLLAQIMNSHSSGADQEESEDPELRNSFSNPGSTKRDPSKRNSFAFFDTDGIQANVGKSDWWKIQLGKYLKLPLKDAVSLGLDVPESILTEINAKAKREENEEGDNNDEDGKENGDEEDEEVDEVIGYHFMECTALFAAYVYVNSASKVFEDRLVNKGLVAEFPDYEAVYHLVIDAVDTYNEQWEECYREQQQKMLLASMQEEASPRRFQNKQDSSNQNNNTQNVESRRMMFMTEKEKKEELIIRQRAELAIKKGTAELDSMLESEISKQVLAALEQELTKLLTAESEDKVHMNLSLNRKSNSNNSDSNNNNNNNTSNNNTNNAKGKRASTVMNKDKKENVANKEKDLVDIDDLFDFDNIDNPGFKVNEDDTNNNSNQEEENNNTNNNGGSNEFAAELLYILKTAISLS